MFFGSLPFVYFPEDEDSKRMLVLPMSCQSGNLDIKKFKETMVEWQERLGRILADLTHLLE